MTIQLVRNTVVAGIYLLLRLLLQAEPEQTRRAIIRVHKLRIFLSLLTIPTWTAVYIDSIMTYSPLLQLPILFFIASIMWLVFDVLREYNALVKAKMWTSEEDPVESS